MLSPAVTSALGLIYGFCSDYVFPVHYLVQYDAPSLIVASQSPDLRVERVELARRRRRELKRCVATVAREARAETLQELVGMPAQQRALDCAALLGTRRARR